MPITKKAGETKQEFISRCISTEIKNGYDEKQAAAICYAYWKNMSLEDFNRIRKFEKQRVFVDSSNVDRVMWDSDTEELVVRFNSGGTYTYFGISEDIFNDIIDGVDVPKTSGENEYGAWKKGVSPSVGATVYRKLIEKNIPFVKGGNFR